MLIFCHMRAVDHESIWPAMILAGLTPIAFFAFSPKIFVTEDDKFHQQAA